MTMRTLISLTNGATDARNWLMAAKEDAPRGKPKACKGCPLRIGGEWEAGATAALASMSDRQRATMRRRWSCHVEHRPCAGMARLAKPEPTLVEDP